MKKIRTLAIFAILGTMLACASTEAPRDVDLNTAIQLASRDVNDTLSQGTNVALLSFSSPSDLFSSHVLEEMTTHLVRGGRVIVVDRRQIDLIRQEMDFQLSGEVSDESAQEIGRMLGAQSIVTGSLSSIGTTHFLRTRVVNVTTAAIQTSFSINFEDSPMVQYMLAQGRAASAPPMAVTATPAQAVQEVAVVPEAEQAEQPAAAPRVFQIGDTGPAGGIIFFDSGNNSGGWRFLEAAPMEAEFQAPWNVRGTYVSDLRAEIGSGRRNTQLIVEAFRQAAGEWDTAAQLADDLTFNGFDDWFLPSRDELDQMFGNLMRRNLGDFRNEWYWSSSIGSRQNFTGGQIQTGVHWDSRARHFVRPIRQVPGP